MISSTTARLNFHFKYVLLTLFAIGFVCFSQHVAAQDDLPGIPARKLSAPNTVSANQLLSSDKALRSVSRARQALIDGQLDKAQAEISKALHEAPDCAIALDIQGAIHLRTRDFDDAASEFQKAINADPTIGQAYVGIGMLLIARNRFKEALVPLDRADALLPSSWLVHFETAIADIELGNINAAASRLSDAEKLAGPDPEKQSGTAYLLALLSIKRGDYKSATKYMQDAIMFEPAGSYAKPAQARIEQMKPLLETDKAAVAMNRSHP